MTIQDNIAADQAAIATAQAALEAANAQLAADQARLDAIQPHLSILERLDAEFVSMEEGAKSRASALVAEMRNLFTN